MTMTRCVEPEWLDTLPPDDPRAVRSRHDLQRVNRVMGNVTIWERILLKVHARHPVQAENPPPQPTRLPKRIVELGAGDGTLLLRILQRPTLQGPGGTILFVDQQSLVSNDTQSAFHVLGWDVETVQSDVMAWLQQSSLSPPSLGPIDVMIANLFLHHFQTPQLTQMFAAVARHANLFVACEPRRSRAALAGSGLLGLMGCNDVSRHDAVISVRAGFADQELSVLWPASSPYRLEEYAAGLFSHCFVAQRR